jgi:hypothetical protein
MGVAEEVTGGREDKRIRRQEEEMTSGSVDRIILPPFFSSSLPPFILSNLTSKQ